MSISRDTIYTIQMLSGTSSDEKPTDVKSGSTFKEIDTGKTYIFDGNTWVLQPSAGGVSDPVLENAKSTGGIGWTEQGEQTVITWDGDTEGRDAFVLHSSYGDVNCYKVAEKEDEYPEAASVELTMVGGELMKLDVELNEYTGAYAYNTQGQPVVIIASAGDINVKGFTGTAPSDGVYSIVQNGFYASSLTYGTPDTIYKIDEKYLPVIPAAPSDDGTYTLTCTVTDGEPVYNWESAT